MIAEHMLKNEGEKPSQELERTYLAKYLPDLSQYEQIHMIDIYIPVDSDHSQLRIRCRGDKMEITKKTPLVEGDSSNMIEQTILLTQEEYNALSRVEGKRVTKTRYHKVHESGIIEQIDIFGEGLKGLIMIDFEFPDEDAMRRFTPPDYCLVEVTQEASLAGGVLCGKNIEDLRPVLEPFGYDNL